MELYVLDQNWNAIGDPIDAWTTLMWYVRYTSAAEASLYLPADMIRRPEIALGNFLYCPKFPEAICEITSLETQRDPVAGSQLLVGGTGLAGLLHRRIILDKYFADDTGLQTIIQALLNQNVISPANIKRRIPNFVFEASTDTAVTSKTASVSYEGENLYGAIEALCESAHLGYRVTPATNGGCKFELYAGSDRIFCSALP